MRHLGILATTPEGAALCLRAFCQDGFAELGPHDHPDVTLDCIALARSLPAWQAREYTTVRAMLSVSLRRLAAAGAVIPLLVPSGACPLPALDSTRLLARAAFDVAAGRRALPAWRGGPPRLPGVAG